MRGPRAQLGEALGKVGPCLTAQGAMGLLLVDASSFAGIERLYGFDAHRQSIDRLAALVLDSVREHLDTADMVIHGETGRDEILVLLFRPQEDARLYTEELPAIREAITGGIARQGSRLAYPYAKKTPPVQIGLSLVLRNPTLGVETQVRKGIEEARADADLNRRIDTRERRGRFVELLLAGNVYCVYEPIVEVATKTVHGYEALSRGPEGTELHPPLAMFRAAGEEDLTFQLDSLCRRKALEGAIGLPEGVKLFLNIRPTTIHDPNFKAQALCRTLEESQLKPTDLIFEISEQESIENFEIFREIRDGYGKLGFKIALDDMGAGYASLEAMMELSPDYIKVDRAFVTRIDEDPGRQELLRALHTVAEKIGSRIIAEGLDTLEELSTLGELGIPFGQGWLFGKPTPLRTRR